MENILRVLVVDDSAYVRKVVKQMLSRSPFVEVVSTAKDGEEALEMVERFKPDVVTLDLIMPNMNGFEFLRAQMARRPVPVVVVSIAHEGGEQALAALDAGAVDFLQKPSALATEKIFDIADELISKVKAAAKVPLNHLKVIDDRSTVSVAPLVAKSSEDIGVKLVAIGISTGGPQALSYLVPQLPADFPVPVAIVLHMPIGYTELYARRLNQLSQLEVVEAKEGQEVRPGLVLLAPAGQHLTFVRRRDLHSPFGKVVTHLSARPFDTLHRPSADVMFQSAAEVWGAQVIGVVMTGMGSDGKQGAAWIKSQGGTILTEAESSCIVYGMPRSVVEAGLSDKAVPLDRMAATIIDLL